MKNKQTKQRLMPYNSNDVHEAFESKYGTFASGGEMLQVNVNVKKKNCILFIVVMHLAIQALNLAQ